MDDRWREFGEVPGYEFDQPGSAGRPGPMAGGGEPPRQPWPPPPPGSRAWPQRPAQPQPRSRRRGRSRSRSGPRSRRRGSSWPEPWPERPRQPRPLLPEDDPPAGPGRPALLARGTLAEMRSRNWLTSLAAPLVAAIAVGVAGVVVLGANNGGAAGAPSALAAGFPPARSAVADFGGGDGRPVEVSAIAAAGPTEVAVGSADRGCALWVSADGGSTWRRAALTAAMAGGAANGQLAGVAHGPSGWLAVGGASAGPAAPGPAVIGSPDGVTWTAAGNPAGFDGSGGTVTAAVAAGPGGYVIVGKASAGPGRSRRPGTRPASPAGVAPPTRGRGRSTAPATGR